MNYCQTLDVDHGGAAARRRWIPCRASPTLSPRCAQCDPAPLF